MRTEPTTDATYTVPCPADTLQVQSTNDFRICDQSSNYGHRASAQNQRPNRVRETLESAGNFNLKF